MNPVSRRNVLYGLGTGVSSAVSLCVSGTGSVQASQETVEASVTFNDQQSDGRTLTINRAASPVDAFVMIQDQNGSILTGGPQHRVNLEAGEVAENSSFALASPISGSQRLVAQLQESNGGSLDSTSAYVTVGSGEPAELSGNEHTDQEVESKDWMVDTVAEIEPDGSAMVTKTVSGSELPAEGVELGRNDSEVRDILRGSDELETSGGDHSVYIWEPSDGDQVSFRVQLGVMHRDGKNGVFNDGVLLGTKELVPLSTRSGPTSNNRPTTQRYEILPPEGWNVAAPGHNTGENTYELEPLVAQETAPDEYLAVGEFEVAERRVDGTIVRAAVLPGTSPPHTASEVAEFLAEITPTLHDQFGRHGSEELPRLGLVTPAGYETGGTARGHSFIANERRGFYNVGEGRSLYAHEYTHTFQQHHSSTGFFSEGILSYLQNLILLDAGVISVSEFRELFRRWVTTPRLQLGGPILTPATDDIYHKAAAVFAALDLDIRARTDGNANITDFIIAVNNQPFNGDDEYSYGISHREALAALNEITGHDYTAFFDLYVTGDAYPVEVLADNYKPGNYTTISTEDPEVTDYFLNAPFLDFVAPYAGVGAAALLGLVGFRRFSDSDS